MFELFNVLAYVTIAILKMNEAEGGDLFGLTVEVMVDV
jgi:hypothetical protein